MVKNMKIGLRLGIGFISILLLLVAVELISINHMRTLAGLTSKLYNHPLLVSNAVLEVNNYITKMHRSMKDLALAQNEADRDRAVRSVNEYGRKLFEEFEVIKARFLGDKRMYEEALETIVNWKPIRDEVITLTKQGRRQEASIITQDRGAKHVALIEKKMEALIIFARNKASSFLANAEATRDKAYRDTALLLIFVVVLGAVIAFFITRSIVKPLGEITQIAGKIATGDINCNVSHRSRDETGMLADAFRRLIDYIQGISAVATSLSKGDLTAQAAITTASDIAGVSTASGEVQTASEQVNISATSLASMGQKLNAIVSKFKL